MRIIILMENTKSEEAFEAEHGLSVYVETSTHKLLVDTGASPKTWENASLLGVDLQTIDTVVLSHGHYDHSGGLMTFARENSHAAIYVSAEADGRYYSEKLIDGVWDSHYIGIDPAIMQLPEIRIIDQDYRIDEELFLYGHVTGRRLWPQSNLNLKVERNGRREQDTFSHEQYVVVESEGKKILISGCAHNGILNILDRFREIYDADPDLVFTGFHMMKREDYTKEEAEMVQKTAAELKQKHTIFYSGHCTGGKAMKLMGDIMGEKLKEMHAGDIIVV